jgi:hypothetical protein
MGRVKYVMHPKSGRMQLRTLANQTASQQVSVFVLTSETAIAFSVQRPTATAVQGQHKV